MKKASILQCGKQRFVLSILLGAVFSLSAAGLVSPAWAKDVEVVEPGQTLFGKSYQQLTGEWANWLQKEPPATNPAFDLDGRFCDLNQEGKIWFLAGTFGGEADRFCRVPAGTGVFFPIFAFVSFAPEFLDVPPCDILEEDIDQIRCDVNDDVPIAPNVNLEVTINGEPVADLFAYRIQTAPGGFTFESGPLFDAFGTPTGDRFPAVVDGYWILLKPLPPGRHEISFSATGASIDDQSTNFTLVVPRRGNSNNNGS